MWDGCCTFCCWCPASTPAYVGRMLHGILSVSCVDPCFCGMDVARFAVGVLRRPLLMWDGCCTVCCRCPGWTPASLGRMLHGLLSVSWIDLCLCGTDVAWFAAGVLDGPLLLWDGCCRARCQQVYDGCSVECRHVNHACPAPPSPIPAHMHIPSSWVLHAQTQMLTTTAHTHPHPTTPSTPHAESAWSSLRPLPAHARARAIPRSSANAHTRARPPPSLRCSYRSRLRERKRWSGRSGMRPAITTMTSEIACGGLRSRVLTLTPAGRSLELCRYKPQNLRPPFAVFDARACRQKLGPLSCLTSEV
eukprot:38814-Chlamydomonas_euryale.AAC.1